MPKLGLLVSDFLASVMASREVLVSDLVASILALLALGVDLMFSGHTAPESISMVTGMALKAFQSMRTSHIHLN